MKHDSITNQATSAVNDGWMEGGSFFSSILAGTLLGYFADQWLGTEPWLVIIGIVVGSYSGFIRVWEFSKKIDENPRGR
ncbi:MAG: AtpZ/AtpI family protein [Acidimicrobiia bacterium]|nr:AtpZ/AtpI family protein [Acidimicrobiia bacterium]MDH3462146.1 AtpZ/AtpI family protein [Acidimicrobiia bacterium]